MQHQKIKPPINRVRNASFTVGPWLPRRCHNRFIERLGRIGFWTEETCQNHLLAPNLACGQKGAGQFGKDMIVKTRVNRRAVGFIVAAGLASLLAACQPEIDHRGYIPKPGVFSSLHQGMTKPEVESILGSPSTTASINFQGDSYYYISSTTRGRSFLKPVETDRQIIAVRFDRQDQVQSVAQYGLEDGRIIDINTRKTPVVGSEFSLLAELFKGVGAGPGTTSFQRRF